VAKCPFVLFISLPILHSSAGFQTSPTATITAWRGTGLFSVTLLVSVKRNWRLFLLKSRTLTYRLSLLLSSFTRPLLSFKRCRRAWYAFISSGPILRTGLRKRLVVKWSCWSSRKVRRLGWTPLLKMWSLLTGGTSWRGLRSEQLLYNLVCDCLFQWEVVGLTSHKRLSDFFFFSFY